MHLLNSKEHADAWEKILELFYNKFGREKEGEGSLEFKLVEQKWMEEAKQVKNDTQFTFSSYKMNTDELWEFQVLKFAEINETSHCMLEDDFENLSDFDAMEAFQKKVAEIFVSYWEARGKVYNDALCRYVLKYKRGIYNQKLDSKTVTQVCQLLGYEPEKFTKAGLLKLRADMQKTPRQRRKEKIQQMDYHNSRIRQKIRDIKRGIEKKDYFATLFFCHIIFALMDRLKYESDEELAKERI